MNQQQNQGVIEVETKFFFLAFLLLFFKPQISIDGLPPQQYPWGTTSFPVLPGAHRVTVFVPYLIFPRMGESSIDVQVGAGQAVKVRWNAPWVVFMPGSIRVLGAAPAQGVGGHGGPAQNPAPPAYGGNQAVASSAPPASAYAGNPAPPAAGPSYASNPAPPAQAAQAASAPPVATPPASTGIAPGWYSDPSTKHELRYYDGTTWTEHVSDGGTTSTDAP